MAGLTVLILFLNTSPSKRPFFVADVRGLWRGCERIGFRPEVSSETPVLFLADVSGRAGSPFLIYCLANVSSETHVIFVADVPGCAF